MSTDSNYKLTGRMDGTNADNYDLEISALLNTAGQSFSIDLSELTYISSLGLRVFLKAAKTLKQQNKKLILSKPSQEILDILLLSGFDQIIEIER